MRLETVLDYLDEEGGLDRRWGAVVLVRNGGIPAGSARAYEMVPVVDVREDASRSDVDLVTARPGKAAEHVPELKAREVASRLRSLGPKSRDYGVFAEHAATGRGEERAHVPIVGVSADPGLQALLFVEWFEGFEREL